MGCNNAVFEHPLMLYAWTLGVSSVITELLNRSAQTSRSGPLGASRHTVVDWRYCIRTKKLAKCRTGAW